MLARLKLDTSNLACL